MASEKTQDNAPAEAPPVALTFEERLQPFLQRVSETVLELQKRRNGALRFGLDGAHIMMVEAASVSETIGVRGYVSTAAFAVIAAMIATDVFNDKNDKALPAETAAPEKPKSKTPDEAS